VKIVESRRRAAETGASGRVRRTLAAGAHRVFEAPLDQRRGDNPVTGQEICTGLSLHHDAHDATLTWQQTPDHSLLLTIHQFSGG